jgi:hypothetical protein
VLVDNVATCGCGRHNKLAVTMTIDTQASWTSTKETLKRLGNESAKL